MENKDSENKEQYMPIFMCLGIGVGTSIGVALDNIGVGMCLGVGIGLCIGVCIDYINRKKSGEDLQSDEKDEK